MLSRGESYTDLSYEDSLASKDSNENGCDNMEESSIIFIPVSLKNV
jgi:hypothetical protein